MNNSSQRLRVSVLTSGLSLLVFASSALLAGCSSGAKLDESLSQASEAVIAIPAPSPTINSSYYGSAVAADNQTLIIADNQAQGPAATGGMLNKGEVRVYTRTGGVENWQYLQTLKPLGPAYGEVHFGQHLALYGNLLVVSASRDDRDCGTYPCANPNEQAQQGSFYVFKRTAPGQAFTPVGTKFVDPSPTSDGRFGLHVATNGKFIAAAAGEGDGGSAPELRIFTIQANGSIVYSYSISPDPKPLAIAMTDNGTLAVVPGNAPPEVRTYQLQASQAVALPNSFGTSFRDVVANGNTIAALDSSNSGRVVMAPVSTSGVGAVTTVSLGISNVAGFSLVENQRLLVTAPDPNRPKVIKYELVGGTWTNVGFIYPPLVTHLTGITFWPTQSLAQTSDFVAFGAWDDSRSVIVSSILNNSNLEGATFEKQKLQPTDACGSSCGSQSFAGAQFGSESALSGDLAAITQPDLNSAPTRNPSVQIYNKQSGTWSRTAGFSYQGKRTRGVAVDSGRVYVGVGTPGAPGSSYLDGAVQVYERNASQAWQSVATLTAADSTSLAGTQVGDYIAASGDIVAVGTYGYVYLFQRSSSGSWSQLQKLAIGPFSAALGQPFTVALTDTYLVVGAPYDISTATNQGSVFVYRRSDWGLEQKFGKAGTGNSVHFGRAVAVDGSTILVGAPDGGGYVDVYERTGTGATPWEHKTSLGVSGADYRIGTSISISGNQALLGAVGDPLTGPSSGAAFLIPKVNGVWDQRKAHILAPSDYGQFQAFFGSEVSLSGATALLTAPGGNSSAGEAYFYDGLVDSDADGVLAADDCNDTDGIAASCVLGGANLSFEPTPRPQWTADSGSYTLSTTHSDGTTSAQLGSGVAKLSSPSFSTTILKEVGTVLAIDIQRPTSGSNAVTLFLSAPGANVYQQVIGTIDLSSFPVGAWKTATLVIPTALRNVLSSQNTNVNFTLQFNAAAPNLLIDNLRFTGTFSPRSVAASASGTVTATLPTTSNSDPLSYCVALKLGNSGAAATSSWSVVINTNGTTIKSTNPSPWGASFSGTTGTVTISSNQAWNASIPAGATAYDPSVGFCATRPSGTAVATVVSASGQ